MGATAGDITVLHVDDEPNLLELAAELLERESEAIDVRTATDADEGLDVLATTDVDCVVSDYDMPGRNGIEFLETVRHRDGELPFILFTGKGSEEVASEAISAGVTDYLQKESGTEQYALLANRIENSVASARAKAEAKRARDRLNSLSQAFPDVAFFIDAEGRYLDVVTGSPSTLLAAEPEELVDSTFHEMLPEDTADRFQNLVERTVDTGEVQTFEYDLEVIAGERTFEARTAPLSESDPEGVVWVARDITEQSRQGSE